MKRLTAVVSLMVLTSCFRAAVRVNIVEPQPNIDLPRSNLALGLDLGKVPDAFEVPEQNGVTSVPVEGWRTSLQAGFQNGIARFFANRKPADFTLKFLKADLEYTPVAVYSQGGGAAAVRARVTYLAQLVDSNGQVVMRMKGQALSRNPWTTWGGSESTAAEALAQMYEEIADDSLRKLAALPPTAVVAPPPVPATDYTPPPRTTDDCAPKCRSGYFCHRGECKSACNPPCPPGQQCSANGQCLSPGAAITY